MRRCEHHYIDVGFRTGWAPIAPNGSHATQVVEITQRCALCRHMRQHPVAAWERDRIEAARQDRMLAETKFAPGGRKPEDGAP